MYSASDLRLGKESNWPLDLPLDNNSCAGEFDESHEETTIALTAV
jgi:hypothetical protein